MPSYRSGVTTNAHANNFDSQGRIMDNSTILNQKQGVLQPSHNAAWQFKYGNQDIPGAECTGASLLTPPIGLKVDMELLTKKQKEIVKQENKIKKGLLANIANVEYTLEGDIYSPDEVETEEQEKKPKKEKEEKAKEGDDNAKLPPPDEKEKESPDDKAGNGKKESWLGKEIHEVEEKLFGKDKKKNGDEPNDEKKSKPK